MIRCLLVDDHPAALATLKQLCRKQPQLQVVGEATTALEAMQMMQGQVVDLVLLDVELPDGHGTDVVRQMGEQAPYFILTTAKKDYAADAFDLQVLDYLVKPISPLRFGQAVARAETALQEDANSSARPEQGKDHVFVRDGSVVKRLSYKDIAFAEAMGDYVKLHLGQKFVTIHSTLKAVEERFPAGQFMRVHRSYLVSIDHIDKLEEGSLVVQGKAVPIADAYRAGVNKRLNVL